MKALFRCSFCQVPVLQFEVEDPPTREAAELAGVQHRDGCGNFQLFADITVNTTAVPDDIGAIHGRPSP